MQDHHTPNAESTLFHKLGLWYVWGTPVLAGLSTFEIKSSEDGFTVTGLLWVLQFALGVLLLPMVWSSDDHRGDLRPWLPWIAFSGILWISLAWAPGLERRNVQETIQLCMPVLVGMIAASVIRTRADLRRLMSMFSITFVLLAIFTAIFLAGVFDEEYIKTRVRPAALTMTLVGCVYLSGYPHRKVWPIVGWLACAALTVATQSRMAAMTLLLAPVIFPMFKNRRTNIATACVFAVLGIGLFYTPVIQKRFFEDGSGKLTEAFQGDYAGAGRFEAWPQIWEEAKSKPLIGHGVGSAYDFVPLVWEDTNHCHNDYLRLFFETGVIGLTFFVIAAIYQLVVLHRQIGSTRGAVRSAYVAVWLGFWAMLVSSATDNTILYNIYFTDSLFAILGAAYGVTAAVNAGAHRAAEPAVSTLTTMRYSPTAQ